MSTHMSDHMSSRMPKHMPGANAWLMGKRANTMHGTHARPYMHVRTHARTWPPRRHRRVFFCRCVRAGHGGRQICCSGSSVECPTCLSRGNPTPHAHMTRHKPSICKQVREHARTLSPAPTHARTHTQPPHAPMHRRTHADVHSRTHTCTHAMFCLAARYRLLFEHFLVGNHSIGHNYVGHN